MEKTVAKLKKEVYHLDNLITKKDKEISRLSFLVDYDFLTGLYNRQGFVREAEKFLEGLKNKGKMKEKRKISFKNFSLIFIDID